MIAHLRGRVSWLGADHTVIDVGGVGYLVWIPGSTRSRLPAVGGEAFLHTSMQVREDSMSLYGFAEMAEKELFEALLAVSGIGPKVALAVLSAATPEQFCRAIALEDTAALTRLPGVGKKLAQRLVLELKERLAPTLGDRGLTRMTAADLPPVAGAPPASAWDEAVEGLVALGYSRAEAATALTAVRDEISPEAEAAVWVRFGLRYLGARRAL